MIKFILIAIILILVSVKSAFAITDPRSVPNNKIGIGILSPEAEIEEVAAMVNAKGEWGWVLVIIKKSERDFSSWQNILNMLTKNHLIPIIRIATDPDSQGNWQKPTDEDAQSWADFLSKLYFPTKNRYIQIYNEVNRASEWGGSVDAAAYTKELAKTIQALKAKNDNFFVLPSPLDLSLASGNKSLDAAVFYQTMVQTVPEIFTEIDGWASHSYPNPNFASSPQNLGRFGIDGYKWELSQISPHLKGKTLPVFITETGWKRKTTNSTGLDEEQIADFYKEAFEKVWVDENIVAVTPFIFNYQQEEFSPFSFKTDLQDKKYFDYYYTIQNLPKIKGEPVREELLSPFTITTNHPPPLSDLIIKNQDEEIKISFKNTGNFIWNTQDLKIDLKGANLQIGTINWKKEEIYPGDETGITFKVKSDTEGLIPLVIRLYRNQKIISQSEVNLNSTNLMSYLIINVKGLINSPSH